ncbi:YdeI/OmpD-associated family protein [Candidatus Woesearchaeota archaeon]|nr:YdeI/OmpD-associated family protein [Candidatus Woesearchaeota archaeon]
MEIGKTVYLTDSSDWRTWLEKNHSKEKEVWLIYYRKSSGMPRLPYNDTVDEALCYGWIDSIVKGIDKKKYAQRFTPRRPRSSLSEMNKERIRRLIKNKRMTPYGLKAVSGLFDETIDKKEKLIIPPDILRSLKANKQAWANFQKFPEGYKKVRIGYIESRRRHGNEAFRKSLDYFIRMTSKNKRFGMIR